MVIFDQPDGRQRLTRLASASVGDQARGMRWADGPIRFIVDSIDCGDQQTGTVWVSGEGSRQPGAGSPYGLWGALGSRDCSESLDAS
ncbi:MAG: hypothetical protein AAGJ40_04125 [Planctomycetota bacterium]